MLWFLPELLVRGITRLLTYASQSLLILSFLLSAAYSLGWVHRFIWYRAEKEISKLLNFTPVTIGSLRIDLIRGKVWASNVVLHSPRRNQWKWESPLLARIGTLYVETNLVHVILSDVFLREDVPLEIYTVSASDIQGFVERKQNVFNFYLVDPHMILPEPQDILDEDDHATTTPHVDSNVSASGASGGVGVTDAASWELAGEDPSDGTDADYETSEKAQRLVDDMVRAVQSLGRAAQQGSLQGALVEQRDNITTKLRALRTSKKSQAMKEGVEIAQKVGKAVVEKTQNVQHFVLPPRRTIEGEKTVNARIGRIVVKDARIFTRDHYTTSTTSSNNPDDKNDPANNGKSSWNKPITLKQVVMRSVELCPTVSAKDDEGLPAVYQPIDTLLDVVWKRLLADVAKTVSCVDPTAHCMEATLYPLLTNYSFSSITLALTEQWSPISNSHGGSFGLLPHGKRRGCGCNDRQFLLDNKLCSRDPFSPVYTSLSIISCKSA
jgi:hypothetical protein